MSRMKAAAGLLAALLASSADAQVPGTHAVYTASFSLASAPSATPWQCFADTDIIVQVTGAGASGAYAAGLIQRSDVNPGAGGVAANPASVLPTDLTWGAASYVQRYHEPGQAWYRMALPANYLPGLPVNVSLMGRSC